MGMGNLQRMAMQMQQEMARVQAELETLTVDGSAGGGVVKATVTGKQELVSVTIDPSAVDPEDVEMLQDLVVSAVNEALRASQDLAAAEDGRGDRRPEDPGPRLSEARRPCPPPSSSPSRGSSRRSSRLPGIGPKTAQRLTYYLLRAPDAEARALARALIAVRDEVVFCERCFNISDAPAVPDLPRPRPRRRPAVRRRGAAGRARDRPDRRVPRPLPRAPRRDQPDRRHRPRAAQDPRAPRPRRRGGRRAASRIEEVILATNPTLEGEATAMYLDERLEGHVGSVTRIARGLPVGGDLEYADDVTLIRALQGRRAI